MHILSLQAVLQDKTWSQVQLLLTALLSMLFTPPMPGGHQRERTVQEWCIGGWYLVAVAILPHLQLLKSNKHINSLSYAQFLITRGHSTSGATDNIRWWSLCNTNYKTVLFTRYCYAAIMPLQKAKTAPKIRPCHLGEMDHNHHYRKVAQQKMAQILTVNVCQQVMPLQSTLGRGVGITTTTSL